MKQPTKSNIINTDERVKFDTERECNKNFLGLLNPDCKELNEVRTKKDATYIVIEPTKQATKDDENNNLKVKFNPVPEIFIETLQINENENALRKLEDKAEKIWIKVFRKSKNLVS